MAMNAAFLDPCLARHFCAHKAAITRTIFNASSDALATSSLDFSVILWQLEQPARCIRFDAHSAPVCDISWSPLRNLIASASADRTIKIWQPKVHNGVSKNIVAHERAITSVDFNLSGSHDKTIKLWNVATAAFISSFAAHTHWVRSTRFSADGQLIASCSEDGTVRIFDPRSAVCVRTLSFEGNKRSTPLQVAWHPHSMHLAVALNCGCLRIYDIGSGDLIQLYWVHEEANNDITFHPNGKFLLSGSNDAKLRLFDLLEGKPIYTIEGHLSQINAVAFSPDGEYFASAGSDRKLLLWKSNLSDFDAQAFKKRQELRMSMQIEEDDSILIDVLQTKALMQPEQQPESRIYSQSEEEETTV